MGILWCGESPVEEQEEECPVDAHAQGFVTGALLGGLVGYVEGYADAVVETTARVSSEHADRIKSYMDNSLVDEIMGSNLRMPWMDEHTERAHLTAMIQFVRDSIIRSLNSDNLHHTSSLPPVSCTGAEGHIDSHTWRGVKKSV